MSDSLLQGVMCQLMEPAVLVDSRRSLVFATESFNRLTGYEVPGCNCDYLLISSLDAQGNGLCCWDLLDDYLALESSGLWLVKRANGSFMPALCTLSPVDISGSHSYIHIRIKSLSPPVGAAELLFLSIREKLGDASHFANWITGYLHNTWGARSEWIELHDGERNVGHIISAGLDRTDWSGPFDIRWPRGKQTRIHRVFPPERGAKAKVLVVEAAKGVLQEELVMNAWAAARVANRQEPAFPAQLPDALRLHSLTSREREVLALLAQGMSDGEIASTMHISVHTVKNHVRHIMSKSGIHKRVKLATLFCQL